MERMWWIALTVIVWAGCGDPNGSKPDSEWQLTENNQSSNNNTNTTTVTQNNSNNDTTQTIQNNNTTSCLPHPPTAHRAAGAMCDDVRGPGAMVDPTFPGIECLNDSDCTDGHNGRCIGNNHDSYYCSYDECRTDAECGSGSVCECEGGFRGDHNVCLASSCATDADCGPGGFCSPSQGDCGAYLGTIGYFCHTCDDECVNDTDCGDGSEWGSYCMYDQGVGHWRCSDSQCAG